MIRCNIGIKYSNKNRKRLSIIIASKWLEIAYLKSLFQVDKYYIIIYSLEKGWSYHLYAI